MDKPILSIETSQSVCSACLYYSNDKFFETNFNLKHSHAEILFENIDYLFNSAKTTLNSCDGIAISSGPGSFTGLRIGMAAVKGMALASKLKIFPVPTFEALAFQISNFLLDNTEFMIMNRVNQEEIYSQKFKTALNSYKAVDSLQILKYDGIDSVKQTTLIFGNALLHSNDKLLNIKNSIFSPSARFVAEWSRKYGQNSSLDEFDYLEPMYFKNFVVKGKNNA
jgi:tRNA threonylcarbamoyl adenosine modification protein YeaZ